MASTSTGEPESQQFGNIVLGGKESHREESVGTLKVHAGGFGWKSRKAGNVIVVAKADLRGAEWVKIPHAYQLKLKAKGGFFYKFNGFRSQDKETIKGYVSKEFGIEIEDAALSYKGWNWGTAEVEGTSVGFSVEGKQAFEIPLTDVAQATAQKNEAVVEMVADDTALPEDELLVEVRFHLPVVAADEEQDGEGTPAEGFVDSIKESGDLEVAGASLVTLDDVPVQVPRGRYDIELFDKYMKLHGKTYDYKVLYANVAAVFLLPKPDGYHMALCITLENPLRQGATSYPHIVLQLPREGTLDVEVALSDEECTERFGDKLEKFETGDTPSVIAKVISAFTKRKVVGIKAGGFNGDSKDDRSKSIRCSLKATEGFLFPLDKAFFFIANKPTMLEFEKVGSIEFNRVDKGSSSSAARTFDITVHMKDMSGSQQFVNLGRSEYKELFRFLTSKKIRIKNIANASNFDGDGDGDGDGDDPYLHAVRRERDEAAAAGDDDDDDDDDSEDGDFQAGEDSDVDEEYSEDDVSGDDEAAGGKKKKKKKKGEKEKKRKAGSDDGSGSGSGSGSDGSGSDSEAAPPKKKAKGMAKEAKAAKASPGGKEKAKKKKKKDKNAPKQGLSAYMIWMQANRDRLKTENPSATFGELGKLAGAAWKELDAEAKTPWEEKAAADKRRYEAENAAYKAAQKAAAAADASDSEPDEEPAAAGSDSD